MPERLPVSLREVLAGLPRFALAFSGGLDSRFVAHAAMLCGCEIFAIHASGPHIAAQESANAVAWLERRRVPHIVLQYNPLHLDAARTNSHERCYACKKELLASARRQMTAAGMAAWPFCDGGNSDDKHGYRPGLKAVQEAGVVSPLMLAGMGKAEIRSAARATGMDNAEQKARPCLLTRFAYGLEANEDKLEALAACEADLAQIFNADADFRLRFAPEPILQISGNASGDDGQVGEILAKHGFAGAKLLKCEKVSGFFDGDDGR